MHSQLGQAPPRQDQCGLRRCWRMARSLSLGNMCPPKTQTRQGGPVGRLMHSQLGQAPPRQDQCGLKRCWRMARSLSLGNMCPPKTQTGQGGPVGTLMYSQPGPAAPRQTQCGLGRCWRCGAGPRSACALSPETHRTAPRAALCPTPRTPPARARRPSFSLLQGTT